MDIRLKAKHMNGADNSRKAINILKDMNEKSPEEFMIKHMGLAKEQNQEIKAGEINSSEQGPRINQ